MMTTMDKIMMIVCVLMAIIAGVLLVEEIDRYDTQAHRIEMKLKSP